MLKRVLPFIEWFRGYSLEVFRIDAEHDLAVIEKKIERLKPEAHMLRRSIRDILFAKVEGAEDAPAFIPYSEDDPALEEGKKVVYQDRQHSAADRPPPDEREKPDPSAGKKSVPSISIRRWSRRFAPCMTAPTPKERKSPAL